MRAEWKVVCLVGLLAVIAAACGESPEPSSDAGTDAGTDACTPLTCSAASGCGTLEDGCGGSITCTESCSCTEGNFEAACPQRPCQTVVGCSASGSCEYAPITCGGQACAPATCTGDGCEDILCTSATCTDKLYPCGDGVCANVDAYCDPSPTVQGNSVVYANVCVGRPVSGCGTCGLGLRTCDDAADRFGCTDVPDPVGEAGGAVECTDTLAGSTYVFLDPTYTGTSSDGSRAKPFTTYSAALESALSRGSRGIVIATSPVLTEPLVIGNGISVYGGYGPSPEFAPNPAHRPRWEIGTTHVDAASNQLVGALALDVTQGTVLFHLEIRTADVTGIRDGIGNGASSIALVARNAPGLELNDVVLKAGRGADGADGTHASSATPLNGFDGNGRNPGVANQLCGAACNVASTPMGQGSSSCGYGGHYQQGNFYLATAGNAGSADAPLVLGGAAGQSSECNGAVGHGGSGAAGRAGTHGPPGGPVSAATMDPMGRYLPNAGHSGQVGTRGTWGGGGGSGGTTGTNTNCPTYPDDPNSALVGRRGGGGGSPGCAGPAGQRGGGGGASVAVVVAGHPLKITHGALSAAQAGRGGHGGNGLAGGSGGSGALGGGRLTPTTCDLPTNSGPQGGCGGNGGRGGSGGNGGGASGASGGHSVGVWCVGGASVVRDDVDVTVGAHGNGGNGGIGGTGGVSASAGAAGAASEFRGCL